MKKIEIKDLYDYNGLILIHTNDNSKILCYIRCISSPISLSNKGENEGQIQLLGYRFQFEPEYHIYNNNLMLERTICSNNIKGIFIVES